MSEMQIGMVGLGVMGQNLALNIADKGFSAAGWDAWPEPVEKFIATPLRGGAGIAPGGRKVRAGRGRSSLYNRLARGRTGSRIRHRAVRHRAVRHRAPAPPRGGSP